MKKLLLLGLVVAVLSCNKTPEMMDEAVNRSAFNPSVLKINNAARQVKGQTLYLPVYSNIPYYEGKSFYGLSAFVAVHNTDLKNSIRIVSVYYLDNDGNLVKDFLNGEEKIIKPLATTNFFVPESDRSGVGANFIVEWMSDSLVNEPLIESLMVSLTSGQGVSFLSKGKVINEVL